MDMIGVLAALKLFRRKKRIYLLVLSESFKSDTVIMEALNDYLAFFKPG